jgi:hypothetical protein
MLPRPLRKNKMRALVTAYLGPIIDMQNLFMAFREYVIYRLTITPQVCFLEKVLNDRYDKDQRRIFIRDAVVYDYLYLFRKDESKPVYMFRKSEDKPVYLYSRAETSKFGVDFTITVPLQVVYNINELIALVNSYKLASKSYKVINV